MFSRCLLALASCLCATSAFALEPPAFRVQAGPSALVVREGLSIVPGQRGAVWFVTGTYWVQRDGRWFTCNRRGAGWRPALVQETPVVLQDLTPADIDAAKITLARANRFAHWDMPQRQIHGKAVKSGKKAQPVALAYEDSADWRAEHERRDRELRQALLESAATRKVTTADRGR